MVDIVATENSVFYIIIVIIFLLSLNFIRKMLIGFQQSVTTLFV